MLRTRARRLNLKTAGRDPYYGDVTARIAAEFNATARVYVANLRHGRKLGATPPGYPGTFADWYAELSEAVRRVRASRARLGQ